MHTEVDETFGLKADEDKSSSDSEEPGVKKRFHPYLTPVVNASALTYQSRSYVSLPAPTRSTSFVSLPDEDGPVPTSAPAFRSATSKRVSVVPERNETSIDSPGGFEMQPRGATKEEEG